MNSADLAFTSARKQAHLIQTGEISPRELVQLYLQRIERYNPSLGCYVTVMAESALTLANLYTERLTKTSERENLPPFFGVPIAIKDLTAVADVPCSYGVRTLSSNIAQYDEGIVTRLKQAGFIILGKTATSEVGSLPYTEPPGFPPTRNPWNVDYTPGGSSGGSASAVAAGLSPLAQGSDGGGSIRGPAFCCGLVGIKPSRGRISYAPIGDYQSGIATNGTLTHNVRDGAALLDIMSGYITGDPYWLSPPEISFLAAADQPFKPLRIAFSTSVSPMGNADPDCAKAVEKTVKLLSEIGHFVEEKCPDFGGLINPFTIVWKSGVAASGIPSEILGKMNQWLLSQTPSAGEYLQAVTQMQIISRQIVAFFDQFDVLILPTYLHPAIKIGAWESLTPEETLEKIIAWIAPCPPFNASGQPALSFPIGNTQTGLPVGVQLIGKPAQEGLLIQLAAQLEALNPVPLLQQIYP